MRGGAVPSMLLRRMLLLAILAGLTAPVTAPVDAVGPPALFGPEADFVPPANETGVPSRSVDMAGAYPGGPPPDPGQPSLDSAGYHFLGGRTSQQNWGVYSKIKVTNAGVTHDGSTNQFYAAWVMLHQDVPTQQWIQCGWAEVSWRDDKQYVFTYDTQHNVWQFYDQYALTIGSSYEFYINHQGGNTWRCWLKWNGVWTTLTDASIGFAAATYADEFGEIYTAGGVHFSVPNTNFVGSQIWTDTWHTWTTAYATAEYNSDTPYVTVWTTKYYDWYLHS
jgi:hypothetical protein